jgi:hypothetical protein
MEKVGIEGLEKCIELGAKNIVLGIKIGEGGLDASDIQYAPEAFKNIQELVAFIASKPELAAQIKDLDAAEGMLLLQDAYKAYQAVSSEIKEEG